MPFVRSYYNGGASDIRAWEGFWRIGSASDIQIDERIRLYMMGDIKLTTNVEFRFAMNDMFQGAVFTDAEIFGTLMIMVLAENLNLINFIVS